MFTGQVQYSKTTDPANKFTKKVKPYVIITIFFHQCNVHVQVTNKVEREIQKILGDQLQIYTQLTG